MSKWCRLQLGQMFLLGTLLSLAVVPAQAQSFGAGARWIWSATDTADQWVAFRKSFTLSAAPTSAVTLISADTHYWLWVNGTLVTFEGGLKRGPHINDTYYDRKDVASYLRSGTNTIAVVVWHFGKSSESHNDSGSSGLLFQSDVVVGGVTTPIISDASWKQTVFFGYIHETTGTQPLGTLSEWNVYYDARNAASMANWTATTYSDSAWPAPVLKGAAGAGPWNALVLRPIAFHKVTGLQNYTNNSSLPTSGNGSNIVATLPSNIQVTPYLQVNAPAGLVIAMQTDHYMDGGAANVRSTYVTTSGAQEFESLGWMSGTAVIYNIPSGVTILGLKYRESGYDAGLAGSFASNDAFFNKLWSKAVRTMYLNMRDNYMDCPTRERAQWWGDVAVDVRGSVYAFDPKVNALTNKAIRELIGWQRSDGVLRAPVPGNGGELPPQILTSITELWDYYLQSGDASALDNTTYQAVKRYMNLWTLDSQGLVNHRTGDWDWEDWGVNIDARVLDNAWYYMALDSTINLANLTGNGADVAGWQTRKNSISASFNSVLWNSTNREYRSPGFPVDTDDRANAMAVVSGLASPANYPDIINVLRLHQNASPYMETFVIEALHRMNAATEAQNRLVSRYTAEVNDPGYTLWEVWDKAGGTDNHGWNGAPLMLSRYGVGARATTAGWTNYEVLPQRGKLTTINAVIPTVKGNLTVNLNASNTTSYTLGITSPGGTTGRIGVPKLASNVTITVSGTTVFQGGAATGSVSGLSYQGNDANYVYFNVNPGTWSFAATGGLITPTPTPTQPPGWNFCAGEGGTCAFTGTMQVRYGSGTTFNTLTLTNGTACTNAVFGDPTPNVAKHCDVFVVSGPTPTSTPTARPTVTPTAGGTNLALNKPATTSSSENAGTAANLAVDGNAGTRWASAFADPQWIMVDLGAATSVTRVRLNWEAAFGKSYQIQTSTDNVSWTSIYTTTTGAGGIEDLTVSGNGRYVRMYGTVRATGYGYSLWEFEVYGGAAATPTATARPTATATARPTATATSTATSTATATATARATSTPTATTRATATQTTTQTATQTARATPTATLPPTTNLALNKPATASSIENAGTTANLAVDGNAGTRWASAFTDPQWIAIDLGAATSITRVRLNWEAAFGKSYQIQTSTDNVAWTSIYTTTTGAGGIQDLTVSGNGRYVRMYGTVRATGYGYSLWEFEVYGGVAATSTPTATARATATPTARPAATATANGGPSGYAFCVNENATCSFSGTASVAYGANGSFFYRTATSSIACNNATFGDPISGVAKACYYQIVPVPTPVAASPFSACALSFPYQEEPGRGSWLGGDSAYSLLLNPTTALWSFQDTFVGAPGQTARAGSTFVANSFALVTCNGGVSSIHYFWRMSGGVPGAILSDGVANQHFWPQQPFIYNGTLFVAMTRVQGAAEEIGTTLARVANPTAPPDQWTAEYFDLTTLPGLGKGTIVVGGYAYLFGNVGTAVVARLPLDALYARAAAPKDLLQYLATDGTWKPGLVTADAKQLGFAANVGTSFRYLGTSARWMVLFLTTSGWPSADIAISTAPSLEGPWSAAQNVYKVPEMIAGRPEYDVDNVCYAAIEHNESNPAPANNLFFSYTCNSLVFSKQLANMSIYLPKIVTVPLPPGN